MTRRPLHAFLLSVVFPGLVCFIFYYMFATNYTIKSFHKEGFLLQYEHGIYKYRVLGRLLFLKTHQLVTSSSLPARIVRDRLAKLPYAIPVLDDKADSTIYATYFLQNGFFLILSAIVLYLILLYRNEVDVATASTIHMVGVLLICITQYVVCPYDNLSYFLILLSILLIVRPFRHSFVILMLALVVNTLVRETSALTLSFFFAYHFQQIKQFKGKKFLELIILSGIFILTYVLLRIYFGLDNALYQDIQLASNFTSFTSLVSIALLFVVGYLLCAGSPESRRCLVFFIASAPYVIAMFIIAMTWELRLWTPIWLSLMILAREFSPKSIQVSTAPGHGVE